MVVTEYHLPVIKDHDDGTIEVRIDRPDEAWAEIFECLTLGGAPPGKERPALPVAGAAARTKGNKRHRR
jgi:hypothetical protein